MVAGAARCAVRWMDEKSSRSGGRSHPTVCFLVALLLLAALVLNAAGIEKRVVVATADNNAEPEVKVTQPKVEERDVVIQSINKEKQDKDVTWLGLGIEEASEALSSQLGLQAGEGLVVTFVAPDSPASAAGFEKHDVLAELDDQILVHPAQFRKLIQMHHEGDTIKLTVFRGGKKQTLSPKLARRTLHADMKSDEPLPAELEDLKRELHSLPEQIGEGLHQSVREVHESLARAGVEHEKFREEVKRGLEQAHQSILEAVRNAPKPHREIARAARDIEELIRAAIGVEKNATVVVRNDRKSIRTMVKADDSGTYVVVATPAKRLTAHDKEGRLLFDGEIETPEQQEKVPKEVWDKVRPMLDKSGKINAETSVEVERNETKRSF